MSSSDEQNLTETSRCLEGFKDDNNEWWNVIFPLDFRSFTQSHKRVSADGFSRLSVDKLFRAAVAELGFFLVLFHTCESSFYLKTNSWFPPLQSHYSRNQASLTEWKASYIFSFTDHFSHFFKETFYGLPFWYLCKHFINSQADFQFQWKRLSLI